MLRFVERAIYVGRWEKCSHTAFIMENAAAAVTPHPTKPQSTLSWGPVSMAAAVTQAFPRTKSGCHIKLSRLGRGWRQTLVSNRFHSNRGILIADTTLHYPVSLIWFQTLGMAIHRWHKSAAWDDYVCFKTACIAVDLILARNKYLTFLVTITYINWQLESWVHFVTADTFSDDGEWKKVRSTDITDMGLVATLAASAGASEVQLLSCFPYLGCNKFFRRH